MVARRTTVPRPRWARHSARQTRFPPTPIDAGLHGRGETGARCSTTACTGASLRARRSRPSRPDRRPRPAPRPSASGIFAAARGRKEMVSLLRIYIACETWSFLNVLCNAHINVHIVTLLFSRMASSFATGREYIKIQFETFAVWWRRLFLNIYV